MTKRNGRLWSGFFTPRLRSNRVSAPSTSGAHAARTKTCGAGFNRCWFVMIRLHPRTQNNGRPPQGRASAPTRFSPSSAPAAWATSTSCSTAGSTGAPPLKVLPPQFAADPERKRRFQREARAASALNHPNIVTVYDFSSDGKLDYLVMEYVPGKPLDRLIPRDGIK